MQDLTQKKCVACEGGIPVLTKQDAEAFLTHTPFWTLSPDATFITRQFSLKDFKEALAFANRIGDIAEEEGHHPDLMVSWGKVGVHLTTHAVKGLSENDFILAAKIDLLEK
ncbi:MAG: 4a-hydroxytetrahydrobiopterin dehydratase [Patescibacteria group bacterium]